MQAKSRTTSPVQLAALVIGVVYFVLGVAGFFTGRDVLWFSSGPVLDLLHTAIGLGAVMGLYHTRRPTSGRTGESRDIAAHRAP
ncbi:hypothetical protein FPZ12_041405 [Amycolatopsis acidicola]|uniref:DUF4383 domain-containing protein n=1 Tax=Amycolatopsis acidicola TaxID=2596893 RepID=A0A5N0UPI9_9PSEU|nr:hypothetical protein [Amycolatopsis acidicola]KAA9150302.1 hypothetical protein FPZ12_041405 [Amycolatopsis acidicola]